MEDYSVIELTNVEIGAPRYEVTAPLAQDDILAKALIGTNAIGRVGGFEFCLIEGKPCVRFRVSSPTKFDIWPEVRKAQSIFANEVRQARKIERVVQAIELARKSGYSVKAGS